MGSNSQPRLREATIVITVQIIRLTSEPTFNRLRFCPLSPPGRIRASRAIAWLTSATNGDLQDVDAFGFWHGYQGTWAMPGAYDAKWRDWGNLSTTVRDGTWSGTYAITYIELS